MNGWSMASPLTAAVITVRRSRDITNDVKAAVKWPGRGGIRPSSSSAPYSPCRTPATSSPRRQPTSPTSMPDVAAALHLSLLLPPAPSSPSSSSSLPSGFKLPHSSVSISPYFSRKVALWRRLAVVQARYGRGRSGDSRQGDFEQDSALDISSIRQALEFFSLSGSNMFVQLVYLLGSTCGCLVLLVL